MKILVMLIVGCFVICSCEQKSVEKPADAEAPTETSKPDAGAVDTGKVVTPAKVDAGK